MSLEGRAVQPSCVFSLTCFHFSDLLQGLHGPPGDKGNRVSLTPAHSAPVTNVFMMWWNDQLGIPDPAWQIVFLDKSLQIKRLYSEGLNLWHAGSLGPGSEIEACIFPPDKGRLNPTVAVRSA